MRDDAGDFVGLLGAVGKDLALTLAHLKNHYNDNAKRAAAEFLWPDKTAELLRAAKRYKNDWIYGKVD